MKYVTFGNCAFHIFFLPREGLNLSQNILCVYHDILAFSKPTTGFNMNLVLFSFMNSLFSIKYKIKPARY